MVEMKLKHKFMMALCGLFLLLIVLGISFLIGGVIDSVGFGGFVFTAGIMVAIIYFVMLNKLYPIPIELILERSDGRMWVGDRARRVTHADRTQVYELLKYGIAPAPSYSTIATSNRPMFYCPEPHIYVPVTFEIDESDNPGYKPTLKVITQDQRQFLANQTIKALVFGKPLSHVMEKYLPIATVVATAVGVMMILYVSLPHITGSFQSAAATNMQAATAIASALEYSQSPGGILSNKTINESRNRSYYFDYVP